VTFECDTIRLFAEGLLREPTGFSFRRRIQVERALFATLKVIARREFGIEVRSFAPAALESLRTTTSVDAKSSLTVLEMAFELKAALAALASGEPYRTWELAGPGSGGRSSLSIIFAKRLLRYATEVEELERRAAEDTKGGPRRTF
jgi:hypothetical protein